MKLAPEPILRAGNDTVHWACVFCRNQTLKRDVSVEMINSMMDAIHAIPVMLMNWRPDGLREVRTHLGCFDADRWPGAPDLVLFFDRKLTDYGYDEHNG